MFVGIKKGGRFSVKQILSYRLQAGEGPQFRSIDPRYFRKERSKWFNITCAK